MKEYVIVEDYWKLALYTMMNLLLTVFLMLLSMFFYSVKWYLPAFLAVTGLWFSVKYMCRYGSKLVTKKPVCEFNQDGIVIHSLPGKPVEMKYRQIKEAKMLRTSSSVKLFFKGENVKHPSGWYYAGVIYPFKRKQLVQVEEKSMQCLKSHGVALEKIEKK